MKLSGPMVSALALAFAAFAGVAYADDPVKAGANYNKPGRQIDDNIVTSRTRFDRPGREIEEGIVTSGKRFDKPGRELDDDVKTRKSFDRPGRAISDSEAKKAIRKKIVDE